MDPIDINKPVPGYYKRKLVKGGVFVPVRIQQVASQPDGSPVWVCEVDGELVDDVFEQWVWCAPCPISETEYRYMLADSQHCKRYLPNDPKANPRKSVDMTKMEPIRW